MENLINSKIKLNLGDLSIVPAPLSKVRSRKECLARYQGGQMPYFVAPMDTVLDANNTQVFLDEGLNVCLPRGIKASGFKVLDNQKLFESVSLEDFVKVYCDYANKSKEEDRIEKENIPIRQSIHRSDETKKKK